MLYEVITELEKIMENSDVVNDKIKYTQISSEYAKISSYFEMHDGYLIDVKIKTVLNGMGFENVSTERQISTLSGGEKTRLSYNFV